MDIVFDFDGVLCEYEGWRGHDHIGTPIFETHEWITELFEEGYVLKLSTTRLNPYPFGLEKPPDKEVLEGDVLRTLKEWLKIHGILHCFSEITGYKPFGEVYIDDRGIRFTNPKQADSDICHCYKQPKLLQ